MSRSIAESFDAQTNSIGFLRWFLAVVVVFSIAGPLAGFSAGRELGTQWSNEQSFGGAAVGGLFFLSAFLITRSRLRGSSTPRFLWRRMLRIVPGFWLALLVTAFVFAPIAWAYERGSLDGFADPRVENSPLTYFFANMLLVLQQHDIAGLGASSPYPTLHGGFEWNGSAATLAYGVGAYLLVAVLGVAGALRHRVVAGVVAVAIIAFAVLQSLGAGDVTQVAALFRDSRVLVLAAPFAFGILVALFEDRIPVNGALAFVAGAVAAYTFVAGGWLVIGQYAFCYALIWFAIRVTRLARWTKLGDFSYGIYLIAWPLMQLAAVFGLPAQGRIVYYLVILAGCHAYAFLSWHLIEKPAIGLRDWYPRPLLVVVDACRPVLTRLGARAQRLLGPGRPTGVDA